jgi:hypothetical protein
MVGIDLVDLPNPLNARMLGQSQFLDSFCRRMTGMVEYDGLTETSSDDSGTFTLKNGPKPTRFDNQNMLYCGSKLYSEAMVGLVLFTGQNTRIFRQNLINQNLNLLAYTKKAFMISLRNPILYIHLSWALVLGFSLCLLFYSDIPRLHTTQMIESPSLKALISKILFTVAVMFQSVPMFLFFALEIISLIMCFSLESDFGSWIFNKLLCKWAWLNKIMKDRSLKKNSMSPRKKATFSSFISVSDDRMSEKPNLYMRMGSRTFKDRDGPDSVTPSESMRILPTEGGTPAKVLLALNKGKPEDSRHRRS